MARSPARVSASRPRARMPRVSGKRASGRGVFASKGRSPFADAEALENRRFVSRVYRLFAARVRAARRASKAHTAIAPRHAATVSTAQSAGSHERRGTKILVYLVGHAVQAGGDACEHARPPQGGMQAQRVGQNGAEQQVFREMPDGRHIDRMACGCRKRFGEPGLGGREQARSRVQGHAVFGAHGEDQRRHGENGRPRKDGERFRAVGAPCAASIWRRGASGRAMGRVG